jgi:23S rRNA pseudouridine2605 synthase
MAEAIRVQKAIARSGLMSRRRAEEAIAEGRVAIDGRKAVLGDRVDIDTEKVLLDGVALPVKPGLETHLLYKPRGVISTADDRRGRSTVVDLVKTTARVFPVGRLDADSEGLILVSNDGDLTNLVTHPSHGITKKYTVLVLGKLNKAEVRRLVAGVELDDGPARALSAAIVGTSPGRTMIEMTMGEGRNREIRRMFEVLGHDVVRLVRTAIGPITDQHLEPGESRLLEPAEILALNQAAKRE